ncbi:hypothetical protein PJU73_06405 [Neisseria lisongii]|uniref:Uncharacterized protein n=1 Tax=Neisseria lisongii TaxID=2912188 RepID=A0ABY7RIE6_9NEIS|nr:hypothetical protein [Neisseria lisongii]WCL70991.1 hypothetical protein PJU73_06405 [Neisseria lisongii]
MTNFLKKRVTLRNLKPTVKQLNLYSATVDETDFSFAETRFARFGETCGFSCAETHYARFQTALM